MRTHGAAPVGGTTGHGNINGEADSIAPSTDDFYRALIETVRSAGGSVTTDGRSLRIRCFGGPLPLDVETALLLHHKAVFDYLMRPQAPT